MDHRGPSPGLGSLLCTRLFDWYQYQYLLLLLLVALLRSWRLQRAWAAAEFGTPHARPWHLCISGLLVAFVLLLPLSCACACSSSTIVLLLQYDLHTWQCACQSMSPAPMGLHEKGEDACEERDVVQCAAVRRERVELWQRCSIIKNYC